jgi:gentisate 1,2-dioxygenase
MIAPPNNRSEYVERIRNQHLAPLWEVLGGLVTPEPKTVIAPFRWRYRDVRPTLLESAGVISAMEAERRVLVFENPNLPGQSKITNSLFGGTSKRRCASSSKATARTPASTANGR